MTENEIKAFLNKYGYSFLKMGDLYVIVDNRLCDEVFSSKSLTSIEKFINERTFFDVMDERLIDYISVLQKKYAPLEVRS